MGLPSLKSYLLLLLSFLNVTTIYSSKPSKEEAVFFYSKFAALYIGDSLVDPGINNHLPTRIKATFSPYGSDFEGGKATGRFSNGKTIADYIAIYYGVPLVPAYLGLSDEQKNNISLTGMNYASASCGILYLTGKLLGKYLSLSVQVDIFKETIEKNLKKNFETQSELNQHLAKSLFMTVIGVNDYAFFYNKLINANDFANKLRHKFLKQLERLHELGARNFFINNIKPLGCYPNMIAKTVPRGSCNERVNRAISIFNNKRRRSLSSRKKKFNNSSFLYSDYFNFMLELREPSSNARSKQLNTTSPCCPKDYDGSLTSSCKRSSKVCKEPDNYIFFDPRHPTQRANFMYSIACFIERSICHVVKK